MMNDRRMVKIITLWKPLGEKKKKAKGNPLENMDGVSIECHGNLEHYKLDEDYKSVAESR